MKRLSLIFLSLLALNAWASDLTSEMDALGANKELLKKARAIDPKNRVSVVQNRDVNRYYRLELGVNYGMVAGGDPYVDTNVLGAEMDFHLSPRWSLGARYYNVANSQSAEGKRVYDDAQTRNQVDPNNPVRFPGVDYAKDEWLVVANWYPTYGKVNLLDSAIAQFDVYLLGGAGQINLSSGTAPLYTAGGGLGIWWTQHFATRLEARWQGYQDKVSAGNEIEIRNINQTLLTATVSFLL